MTPEKLKVAEDLYFELLEAPPSQRVALLDRAAAGDYELRGEVESLLSASTGMGAFLETPVLGVETVADALAGPEDLSGTQVGAYRLEQRLAAGGMGTVYLAQRADGQFAQRVAVKLVKRGMDSDEIIRKFRQERQTLASLDHPHIARLIDGGAAPDGRPYLVMEYIDGRAIDEACAAATLTIPDRLRLFLHVCDAVRYAHAHLVVHRDLKPSNILVTPDGTPKLLDFGISRVLDQAVEGVTAPTQRPFTPEYASPEQVSGGRVATASDVYSLGVVLYELLTGRRPYDFTARSPSEIERVVCTRLPPAPSASLGKDAPTDALSALVRAEGSVERLRRTLAGDLDTIVLMALRKEPERRYASAEQLAGDIERYLRGLPIAARKDTLGYRMGKFIKRNRAACAAGFIAALTIVGGTTATAWQAKEAAAARDVANDERDQAYQARDQAEQVTRMVQGILQSADAGADTRVADALAATIKRIDSELANQPLVHASVQSAIGKAYIALGLYADAEKHILGAQATRAKHLAPTAHDVSESKMDVAELRFYQNRFDEAETLLRQAVEDHTRLRGEDNEDTARAWSSLGSVLRAQNKLDEAERCHRTALRIRTATSPSGESLEVAESLNNLANVLRLKGDQDGMLAAMEQALTLRQKLLKPEHPLLSQSLNNMGLVLDRAADMARTQGRADQADAMQSRAESLVREAVALSEKSYGPDHPAHAQNLKNLGVMLMKTGRPKDAIPPLAQSAEILSKRLGEADERRLNVEMNLARARLRTGDEQALDHLARTLDAALAAKVPIRAQWQQGLDDLCKALEAAGRTEDAKAWRQRTQK